MKIPVGLCGLLLALHCCSQTFGSVFLASWASTESGVRPRVGDEVTVFFEFIYFGDWPARAMVDQLAVEVHHRAGTEGAANLLTQPLEFHELFEMFTVVFRFRVLPDDPDIILIDYAFSGTYDVDGPGTRLLPGRFAGSFGCQIARDLAPVLNLHPAAPGFIQLSWCASGSEDWILESSEHLNGSWSEAPIPSVRTGSTCSVTLPASGKPHEYFRLRKP